MIRTLLLDADGVIQQPSPSWREAWRALLPAARRSDADLEAFRQEVFTAEQPTLEGKADIAIAMTRVLARWGSASRAEDALAAWTLIDTEPRVLDAVAQLRLRGVAVHLATNQQEHRARYMSEQLGYRDLFDREYYSCRIGAKKPSTAYFEHILVDLRCDPRSVLFIDDVAENVAGAQCLGIHAAQHHIEAGYAAFVAVLERFGVAITGEPSG